MNAPSSRAENSSRTAPSGIRWLVGILAAVILVLAFIVPVGLAALFLLPMVVVIGIGMWTVWIARRRRQWLEDRDAEEIKHPFSSDRVWPTEGVIDDRLELPAGAAGPTSDDSAPSGDDPMPTSDEKRDAPP